MIQCSLESRYNTVSIEKKPLPGVFHVVILLLECYLQLDGTVFGSKTLTASLLDISRPADQKNQATPLEKN